MIFFINSLFKEEYLFLAIPDAAGRQWFINMGKYFGNKGAHADISTHATALNIPDPRDLIACIQDTTSNTARQVIRYLYSSEQLLKMVGPDVPEAQRVAIRSNYISSSVTEDQLCFILNRFCRIAERPNLQSPVQRSCKWRVSIEKK